MHKHLPKTTNENTAHDLPVTCIPIAPTVVIAIVADAVPRVPINGTGWAGCGAVAGPVRRIQAKTLRAQSERVLAANEGIETATTITIVPVAGTFVIFVVAKVVSDEERFGAGAITGFVHIRVC